MWGIIIATVTGTGIGLSVHIFHNWLKYYLAKKQNEKQKLVESIVLDYLKQLQKDEQPNGNTKSNKEKEKS
jgi:hypothetical protein